MKIIMLELYKRKKYVFKMFVTFKNFLLSYCIQDDVNFDVYIYHK